MKFFFFFLQQLGNSNESQTYSNSADGSPWRKFDRAHVAFLSFDILNIH